MASHTFTSQGELKITVIRGTKLAAKGPTSRKPSFAQICTIDNQLANINITLIDRVII